LQKIISKLYMKMKKITLGFSLLVAAALSFTSCNKGTNTPPEQDMEFQSSKDVSFANSLVTELELIVSYAAERYSHSNSPVFTAQAGSPGSILVDLTDTTNKIIKVNYTNSVTCRDGKKRDGQIVINFSGSNASFGAKYYRDAGFVAKVTLNGYWVDGWKIVNIQTFTVTNNMGFGYKPNEVDVNWTMKGALHLQFPEDTMRNMVWEGSLTKTLVNSESASIFNPSKLNPINWVVYVAGTPTNAAQLAYTGTVTGVTSRVVSYTYVVDDAPDKADKALVRNLMCAPDRITAATSTSTGIIPIYSEWHPFISGVASFTSLGAGTTEPRTIDYASGETSAACDNAGTVTIKGVTYSIDFKK
jgi:hypothetical protein